MTRISPSSSSRGLQPDAEVVLVDISVISDLMSVSTRHVERLAASGRMPAPVRLGRARRWHLKEIRDWLSAGAPDRRTWIALRGLRPQ